MQKALESLPGVANVETDAETQQATCTVDPSKFDKQKAFDALAEAGYPDGSVADGSE